MISGEGPLTIEGVPVVRLVDLHSDWLSLPMWLAVFNRNADSDLNLLKDRCLVHGIGKVLMPQEYFEVIEPEMGWRFWLTDRRHYAEKRRDIEAVYDDVACAITQGGQDRILTVRLDHCLPTTDVDFLKLDVEGHEMSALEGARRVVESSRPLLALAAYHRWDDVWRLAEFLCRSSPDYRLSLLSHESNTFDSVLYGIS